MRIHNINALLVIGGFEVQYQTFYLLTFLQRFIWIFLSFWTCFISQENNLFLPFFLVRDIVLQQFSSGCCLCFTKLLIMVEKADLLVFRCEWSPWPSAFPPRVFHIQHWVHFISADFYPISHLNLEKKKETNKTRFKVTGSLLVSVFPPNDWDAKTKPLGCFFSIKYWLKGKFHRQYQTLQI